MIFAALELRGFEEEIATLKAADKAMGRTVLNAIRRVVRRRVAAVKKDIRDSSGIGKRIWGGETSEARSNLGKFVSMIRTRIADEEVETGIRLTGLPRLIETGGSIKPHIITAKRSPFLFFANADGVTRQKTVNHPGALVRGHGFAHAAIRDAEADIVREIDEALGKLWGADGVAA